MEKENNGVVKALTKQEINTIERFYETWKLKKPEVLDEICMPDWKDIPLAPQQEDNPKGLQSIMKFLFELCPDIEIVVHEIFGSHERAAVRASMEFTHVNEIMGIAPTNKKVSIALHEFHYLKNGKLTHTWHLEDWFGLLMQSKEMSK
ncbi:ester cyclase [Flavobacterium sp. YJ01]|uniref:ester cyclase n=1 Tax=unclassified Flavobacterium TaxID=196869 RepID=UPI0023E3E556|nr:ester cyclase [Flavobacterium sp. YJ01]WET02453.1 ester cyclase [Flavobacterium sp. YJ01]